MAWMIVEIDVDGKAVLNDVNIDTIVRYGPREGDKSYMKFVDGSTIDLLEPFLEIRRVIVQTQGKQQ